LNCQKEVVLCINAPDLEKQRVWKSGETYEETLTALLQKFESQFGKKPLISLNRYHSSSPQPVTTSVTTSLTKKGYNVYIRKEIEGYPDVGKTFGEERGFVLDDHLCFGPAVELVVVIGLGSNCGKLSTCLGQVYLDWLKLGQDSGYAKYELFPIWNLPIDHPTALAYEAATADIEDVVVVDTFHQEAYGKSATNYNRDVDAFPILSEIMMKASSPSNPMREYRSPTDMGVNQAGFAIIDHEVIKEASIAEVHSRLKRYDTEVSPIDPKLAESCMKRCLALLERLGVKTEA